MDAPKERNPNRPSRSELSRNVWDTMLSPTPRAEGSFLDRLQPFLARFALIEGVELMIAEFLADEGLRGFHSRLDAARLCESTPHDPLRFRVELPDSAKLPIRDDPVVMVFLHRIGVAMQLEVRIAK